MAALCSRHLHNLGHNSECAELTVRFERQANFLRIIIEGEMTIEDMYAGVDEIYASDVPKMVLWDMLSASASNDGKDAATQLQDFSKYATDRGGERTGGRVALLASSELLYGFSRMSTSYSQINDAAYTMVPFRDEGEAMAWLGEVRE